MTTRWSRPRLVRATIASPFRNKVRCATPASAASTASAIGFSLPETDSMSQSARVRSIEDAVRSSAVAEIGGIG